MKEFDYIIVGAGAAGSVVARRLVDAGGSVLLLEAGKSDRHPYVRVPAGFFKVLKSGWADWGYQLEPQEGLNGRSFPYARGKVLGGSGSINGLMQSWGLPYDYDRWSSDGCTGWSFAEVRPYFMRSESYAAGDPSKRGRTGPIVVSGFTNVHPIAHDFLQAATELQFPVLEDYNGESREGVGLVQQTRNGRFRETSATAYLYPIKHHSRLAVQKSALACQVLIDDDNCARGVSYLIDGVKHKAFARKEVILCAGAVNTPHLLNLSGIGDGVELRAAGIEVKSHLPGVGHGLQDHYSSKVVRRVRGKTTLNEQARGLRLVKELVNYVLKGKGILTYSYACVTGYVKSSPALDVPDLQLAFSPGSFVPNSRFVMESKPGITLGMWQMRPESRGYVRTVSPDPQAAPAISPAYLLSATDQRCAVAALRWSRRFLFSETFDRFCAEEVSPGAALSSDQELLDYARQTGSSTYHPVGSCRMGTDDQAVVDPQLRVRGVSRLRIVDASIMPHLTSSNTHAPVVMIAEKASDMILREHREG